MPLYTIATQAGSLPSSAKEALAARITELHVTMAKLPASWVHILFEDYPTGNGFSAGKPAAMVALTLTIRTGRSTEYKRALLAALWGLLQTATGAADDQIVIGIQEVAPSQAMEMGSVMPDVS
ncbi:tautomerase family protein [Variovorax sp. J22P168]|uniref:tautomerase family protein n=1 Tax=Variovorax jilinensis TaxID=3053513 RepID=UPI0025759C35|nr:tautomerase family protein [Variovorax sp. J22P168]MDM0015215.1 tautomerase family protein [Variovorax sp. J22P168]